MRSKEEALRIAQWHLLYQIPMPVDIYADLIEHGIDVRRLERKYG